MRRRAAGPAEPWASRAQRSGRVRRVWPAHAARAAAAPRTAGDVRRREQPVGAAARPAREPVGTAVRARADRTLPERFRRRRRIAAAVLALFFAVVGGGLAGRALLYDAGLADVEGLEITGLRTVAEPAVRAAASVQTGVPLAGVDLDAIERRVEQLPAVAHAEAGRDWPHTITVAVTERVPVAVGDTPGGPHLVDAAGVAYLPAPDRAALPRLAVGVLDPGAPATPAVRAALGVLAALPPRVRGDVQAVEVGVPPALAVTLRLTEDREVRWGSPDRSMEKAAVLGPLLSQHAGVYDVASPELPTIRR